MSTTTITHEQLAAHRKWVYGEVEGKRLEAPRANLRGAVLTGAVLRGANLTGAVLRGANLTGADLTGVNLTGADLTGAVLRGANLTGAVLRGAVLRCANLTGANGHAYIPVIPDIHKRVLAACTADGCELDMSTWHTCETTHCRAGWVVTLAGEGGKVLEGIYGTGTAAALIYQASDPKMAKVPNFFCDDDSAMEDMRRLAGVEG